MQGKFLKVVLFASAVSFALIGSLYAEDAQGPEVPVKSLYERLGGESAIQAVVDDFVPRAAANPAVNFTRQGKERTWEATPENIEILKKHLVQFIASSTGGPQVYEGKDMVSAHKGMQISQAEFDALAADLKTSLEALNVPEVEKNDLLAVAGSVRGSIVEENPSPAAEETKAA